MTAPHSRPSVTPTPAARATARASAEVLERRQLLSAAGNLDPTFGQGGVAAVAFPLVLDSANPDADDSGVDLRAVDNRNGLTVVAGEHRTGSAEAGQTFDR